jgi:hypothetical protein
MRYLRANRNSCSVSFERVNNLGKIVPECR